MSLRTYGRIFPKISNFVAEFVETCVVILKRRQLKANITRRS